MNGKTVGQRKSNVRNVAKQDMLNLHVPETDVMEVAEAKVLEIELVEAVAAEAEEEVMPRLQAQSGSVRSLSEMLQKILILLP